MTQSVVFYTHPMSRGRVVRWMLEETGIDYSVELIEYGPVMKGADYLKLNPMGKVPTLVCGEEVITEVAAICAFLADRYPESKLQPSVGHRGAYFRWLFFGAGPLEAVVMNKAFGFVVPTEKEPMAGFGSFERVMRALELNLEQHQYVAGDTFSAADVYIGSHINWGFQFGTIEKRPTFEKYLARLTNRAPFQRATELDDALMPKQAEK